MVVNSVTLTNSKKVLLIDIGGTNIRTSCADIGTSVLLNPQKVNTSCLNSFDDLIQNFLTEDPLIDHIVFSVAGPKVNNSITMTNREFKLDADAPYTKPSKEELTAKPESLPYPKSASKYRFYGNNIQIMIDVALTWEEGEMKDTLLFTIANHMKKCYLNWNKDTVDDAVIFKHLLELSGQKFDLTTSEEPLSESKNLLKKRSSQQGNKSHKSAHHKNSHKNNNRKK